LKKTNIGPFSAKVANNRLGRTHSRKWLAVVVKVTRFYGRRCILFDLAKVNLDVERSSIVKAVLHKQTRRAVGATPVSDWARTEGRGSRGHAPKPWL